MPAHHPGGEANGADLRLRLCLKHCRCTPPADPAPGGHGSCQACIICASQESVDWYRSLPSLNGGSLRGVHAVRTPGGTGAVMMQMRRSTVIGLAGSSIQDNIRTSYGTFLLRRHDSTIARMEDRLAAWTQLPMIHQEDLQVCHTAPSAMQPMTCRSLSIILMSLPRNAAVKL